MRNRINIHTVLNDTLLGTLKFVSKTQDYLMYGDLIPEGMINQDIKDSKAYKTYLEFATRKATPKKARKFNKVDSHSKKLSLVLEEEPLEKPKQAKKPAKKSTIVPTAVVVIRDTPGVSMSKKKPPTKVDRGKGMDLLSEAALLEAAQIKKTLKKSTLETHKLHASGLGDGVGSQPKVPDEQQDNTTGINKGTDDDSNDDDSDDVSNDGDDDVNSDDGEEEYEEEYIRTPNNYEFTDDEEEYEELYKYINVRLRDVEHGEEGKEDTEKTDVGHDAGTQETTYEQVKDDEPVILTIVHDTQKTEVPLQSSSISSDFATQFLNLDNPSPTDTEINSMMNIDVRHEEPSTLTPPLFTILVTAIPETSSAATSTIHPLIPPFIPIPQTSTPTPAPTTETTTTLIPALPNFSSLFEFDQRVFVLEKELSQLKQVDYSTQLLETIKSQITAMLDAQLSTRLEDSIKKTF
ncbi:hypothetical protein Tco_1231439, partial [Tanacetum coccineum]